MSISCIAISGLGGHAFGSWKDRNSHYMWLRDALPHDLPGARVLTYGYDTRLAESSNFQNLEDIALTFRASLRIALSRSPPERPLIFIAHSLGGLVLKQALIQIASGDGVDRRIFESTYGILFFGVPNHGMDISSLLAMVDSQPNLPFLTMLSKHSGNLQGLVERFRTEFDFKDSQIISFYETCASRTARKDTEGKWSMSGEYAVLVDRFSAKSGRSWEESHLYLQPIGRNHSEMVKFSEYDELGVIVGNSLIHFARTAPAVIRDRVNRLEPSTMSGPSDPRTLADRSQPGEEADMEDWERPHETEHKTVTLGQSTGQQSKEKKWSEYKLPEGGNQVLQGESKRPASLDLDVRKKRDDLEMFANAGFDIEVETSRNRGLIWAARKGHLSLVQRLLDRDSKSVEHTDKSRRTPLHWAAYTANLDLFYLLLSRGANIHTKSASGHSMLHLIISCNMDCGRKANDYVGSSSDRKAIGLKLLSLGLPVDIPSHFRETPLLCAARCGLEDIVIMLISEGANLSIRDWEGCPPLIRAAQNRHMGVVKAIIERQKEDTKWSAVECLVLAASTGMLSAVESLLDAGVMIESTNVVGNTALISAVENHRDEVVRLLLSKGANVESKDRYGERAIMVALSRSHVLKQDKESQLKIIWLLIDGGANVNAEREGQDSPLHTAALYNIPSAVDLLLREGADPLPRNARGNSPLDFASNKDIKDKLLTSYIRG